MNRACGDCQVCCVIFSVDPIKKEAGKRCPAQSHLGCKVYDIRPHECRAFRCLWLEGVTPESERPDKCGYVLAVLSTKKGALPSLHWLNNPDTAMDAYPTDINSSIPWAEFFVRDGDDDRQRVDLHVPVDMSDDEESEWKQALVTLYSNEAEN